MYTLKETSLIIALGFALFVWIGYVNHLLETPDTDRAQVQIRAQDGKVHNFEVELALTPQQQSRGLMHRESLPYDQGMLFIFNRPGIKKFWMKNTLIPLDILFIHPTSNRIMHIDHNRQPRDLTPMGPNRAVGAVLEIAGGEAKLRGIAVGDKVVMPDLTE